jgi:Ca2+-binding RTX toxin-like protein
MSAGTAEAVAWQADTGEPDSTGAAASSSRLLEWLRALCAVARVHQIAADPQALAHELGFPESHTPSADDLIRAARHIGLKARGTRTSVDRLPLTPLPALAALRRPEGTVDYVILAQCDGRRVLLQDSSFAGGRPVIESVEAFAGRWTGELVLLASRASTAGGLARFDFSWFIPALVKYRRLLGEVLLISFVLQLLALVSPLFFQVVMDKVLVHKGLTTLDVLVIGLVLVVVFESALSGLRSYVFNRGDGSDTIDDSGHDSVLRLGPGVSRDDIVLGLGSLLVGFGSGDQIHFQGFDPLDARGTAPLGSIELADGDVLGASALLDRGFDIDGTAAIDHLQGTSVDDRIRGFDGADQITSFGGNDVLDGGAGDDVLDAGDGSDVLSGGAGNDLLRGGAGDDVYRFSIGGGHDVVDDTTGTDEVLFGDGIAPGAIAVTLVNGSIAIATSGGDTITIDGSISRYRFADGSVLTNDEMLARVVPESAPPAGRTDGTDGNDVLVGGPGDDVIIARAGDDSLDGAGGADLLFGDAGADLLHGGEGADVLAGGDGDDTLHGDAGPDRLWGQSGNDLLYGGSGDDELSGGTGDDILVGGMGRDLLLAGGTGTKTYRFDLGDGEDVLASTSGARHVEFGAGVLRSDIRMSFSPADASGPSIQVRYSATDSMTILLGAGSGALDYRFADGTVVSQSALAATATQPQRAPYVIVGTPGDDSLSASSQPSTLIGEAGNDVLDGGSSGDVLRGGSGDDLLRGRGGDDVLDGGPGNDELLGGADSDVYVYSRGDGSDVIAEDAGGVNVLRFADLGAADLSFTRPSNGSLVVHVKGSSDAIEIRDWYSDPASRLQQIAFADGTVADSGAFDDLPQESITSQQPGGAITGTDFDDVIVGSQAAEWIDGRGGDDLITGRGGSDVYSLRWGMGVDTIVESGSEVNVLRLEAGVELDQLVLRREGNDLMVELGGGSAARLKDYYGGAATNWLLRRLDGTETAIADLLNPAPVVPVVLSVEEMRARWLADGEQYYAALYTDPASGAGPDERVSLGELSYADDVRDMYRQSNETDSLAVEGSVTRQIQVPVDRYDVQDLGQGRLLITDYRNVGGDGQATSLTYNPDEGVRMDWIGQFDTRPAPPSMRTITVTVATPPSEFHINVESITGGPSDNSIGTEGFGAVDGGAGDDVIWGMWAIDDYYQPGQFLYGGDGNDFVMGSFGKDVVIGGTGDDYLAGSSGPDTYYLVANDGGTKVIDEAAKYWTVPGIFHRDEDPGTAYNIGYQDDGGFYGPEPRNDDTVAFGAGIDIDHLQMRRGQYTSPYAYDVWWPDPADQQFDTLDFAWGNGQTARVLLVQPNGRASEGDGTGIERFTFADGTSYTMAQMKTLVDTRAAQSIMLWRGDGHRSFALPADINSLTIGPGIATTDLGAARDASDLVFSLNGTADQWRLVGWFDNPTNLSSFAVLFADGTRWSGSQFAPQDRPPSAGLIADQQATEDQPWSFRLPDGAFTDPDAGDVLAYSVRTNTGAAMPSWLHFDAVTRTFSGTPSNGDVGAVAIEVTAVDAAGASASGGFAISVVNVNDPPTPAALLERQAATETLAFAITVPDGLFTDIDAGDSLTLRMTQADGQPLPGWLSFDGEHRLLHGLPVEGAAGTWSLLLTAVDVSGASASQAFDLDVSHAPHAAAPLSPAPASEDGSWTFTIPVDAFTDADVGDTLAFAATSLDGSPLPAWLSFDAATRTFTGTPGNDDVGAAGVQVVATDPAGASARSAFQVEVLNVNDAPQAVRTIPAQEALEDSFWQYAIQPGTFIDIDRSDRLAYSARLADGAALPAWLAFDAGSSTFAAAPTNDDVGTVQVAVTATDSAGAVADATFTLRVTNVNDAPVAVGSLTPWSVIAGDAVAYSIPVSAFKDVDAGDRLTLAVTLADGRSLPSWLTFDAATRALTGSPAPADAGDLLLSVLATDTSGATASQSLMLQVKPGLTLQGTTGTDTLTGRSGNDLLDGGAGADRMAGGKGDDTYIVGESGDVVVELPGEGIDTVRSALSYTLPANVERLYLDGSARAGLPPLPVLPSRAMVPGLTGTGNALDNLLVGNAENNVLTGLAGNDTLDGRGGNDRLIGGAGNDRYLFGRGVGRDTIEENDAAVGNTDSVVFGTDVRSDQLWFRKQGNDLQVSIVGGDDLLTVSNWYKGSQYRVEQFRTADGKMLLDSRVQQLVDAMASFSPPPLGQTSLPAAYQQQLTPVLAANWQ